MFQLLTIFFAINHGGKITSICITDVTYFESCNGTPIPVEKISALALKEFQDLNIKIAKRVGMKFHPLVLLKHLT